MNKTLIKRLQHQAGRKLNNTSGETLAETLTSVIILALAVLLLTGAIVTAARVNHQTDNTKTTFTTENQTKIDGSITIKEDGKTTSTTLPVTVYTTENEYIYYQLQGNE